MRVIVIVVIAFLLLLVVSFYTLFTIKSVPDNKLISSEIVTESSAYIPDEYANYWETNIYSLSQISYCYGNKNNVTYFLKSYWGGGSTSPSVSLIEHPGSKDFSVIKYCYSKSRGKIYYGVDVIKGANEANFVTLSNLVSKDDKQVYLKDSVVKGVADASTFSKLSERIFYDTKNVYYLYLSEGSHGGFSKLNKVGNLDLQGEVPIYDSKGTLIVKGVYYKIQSTGSGSAEANSL